MQTFYETNFYFYKRGKTKRHPLTKIITDVVYKEKKRGGNMNKMTVYVKMFTAFGSEQSVSAAWHRKCKVELLLVATSERCVRTIICAEYICVENVCISSYCDWFCQTMKP